MLFMPLTRGPWNANHKFANNGWQIRRLVSVGHKQWLFTGIHRETTNVQTSNSRKWRPISVCVEIPNELAYSMKWLVSWVNSLMTTMPIRKLLTGFHVTLSCMELAVLASFIRSCRKWNELQKVKITFRWRISWRTSSQRKSSIFKVYPLPVHHLVPSLSTGPGG